MPCKYGIADYKIVSGYYSSTGGAILQHPVTRAHITLGLVIGLFALIVEVLALVVVVLRLSIGR